MRPRLRRLDAFAAERGCGRLHINPIVPCTIADCRRQGLDVEEGVREGLVDSVVFGMMRIWEDEGYRKLFRILKIDGISISAYHPNWIG